MARVSTALLSLALCYIFAPAMGAPLMARHEGHDEQPTNTNATPIQKQNGLAAQKLNAQFAGFKTGDSCDGTLQ
jgi:hypothetical protein